jgi:hypothetical protein
MNKKTRLEVAISCIGLVLTALGILVPSFFVFSLLGVVLTAVGVGMLLGGSITS